MQEQHHRLIAKNSSIVARRYKAKCWYVEAEDLKQEAYCAQLTALKTYDHNRGPFIRYAWRTAVISASMATKRMSSPVSTSRGHEDNLLGTQRASLHDAPDTWGGYVHSRSVPQSLSRREPALLEKMLAASLDSYELLTQKQRAQAIRDRVLALLGSEEGLEFALAMLSQDYRPADVSKEHAVPVRSVYRYFARIKEILENDPELYRLWKEQE
jgi:hypothetical protein